MSEKNYSTALSRFAVIARLEGISYLTLLCIAMPLKYAAGIPEAVIYVGWAHGLLFISYIVMLFVVQYRLRWPFKIFFLAGFASIIPFGPFILDKKILQKQAV